MKFSIVAAVLFTYYCMIWGQDVVFPKDEEDSHVSGGNSTIIVERIPILIPGACPQNMLSYPGDGSQSSWVCDCKARFLYFPQNNSCHEAFKQGPCPQHYHVVLSENEAIPKCELNRCLVEGMVEGTVEYKGVCHRLGTIGGPCGSDAILNMNETSFQLECSPINDIALHIIIDAPRRTCPPGTRRSILGMCKKVV